MQASILPKRAVREAQKLGVSAAYLSGGVFRAALCQVRRCRALRTATPAIVRHSVRHSVQPTFAGIRPLQQKLRNIIPVFVLCNADSVIGCFSSISGYLSGQFTYNAPLNEKTHKRSV